MKVGLRTILTAVVLIVVAISLIFMANSPIDAFDTLNKEQKAHEIVLKCKRYCDSESDMYHKWTFDFRNKKYSCLSFSQSSPHQNEFECEKDFIKDIKKAYTEQNS